MSLPIRQALMYPHLAGDALPRGMSSASAGAQYADERIYAPFKMAAVVRTVNKLGVSACEVLKDSGVRPAQLTDVHARTSIRQFMIVCANALRLCPQPGLGFQVGRRLNVTSYGMYGYALMSSASMREAYESAVRFHRLATPTLPMQWEVGADSVLWVFPPGPSSALPHADARLHRFLLEMQLAIHWTLHREIGGEACTPSKVVVAGPPPAHAPLYRQVLACPVTFHGQRNEMHYPLNHFHNPTRLANPLTAASVSQACVRMLDQCHPATGLAGQVHEQLTRVPGAFPTIDEVAHALHVSTRTLHRRLQLEGTSFRQLATDVRRTLAVDYLKNSQLNLEDIAGALGFSDSAGFRHAFKRWTKQSPSEFRRGG